MGDNLIALKLTYNELEQMLNDGQKHLAETYNKKFGTNLLVTRSPINDDVGRLFGGVHAAHDITTRTETEEAS